MTPFTLFAPAKINLALHVLGRGADGYHNLDSIVAFADVGDELTFSPAQCFAITTSGPFAADLPPTDDNIVARTWTRMLAVLPDLAPVSVHLVKNLPVASGIGGGSADAAAAIRAALRIAGITQYSAEVMAVALSLGADVPVCLMGKACRMQGVGERLEPLAVFKPLHAILVNPLAAVPTPAVFRQLGLEPGQGFGQPITDPADQACWRNDLAPPAIAVAPVIGEVMTALHRLFPSPQSGEGGERQRAGGAGAPGEGPHPSRAEDSARHLPHASRGEGREAPFVGMSGSGATCFAVLPDDAATRAADAALRHSHRKWWVARTILS